MNIERNYYLRQLIDRKDNGLIKIITGIRRCGKSYLLFELYYQYLRSTGIEHSCILRCSLDEASNARYRNPMELDQYVRHFASNPNKKYYIFLDEIQFVKNMENPWLKGEKIGYVDVVLGLMKMPNADIYITGSNSKMLSSDIVTQFRDKGDAIHLYPLTYSEICRAKNEENEETWNEYLTYGGLPRIFALDDYKSKIEYLSNLFKNTYLKDVLERYDLTCDKSVLDNLIRFIASSIGSLTNPKRISDTFKSVLNLSINSTTIDRYLDCFSDAFIIQKVFRFDVKRRKYIGTPMKYYFTDIGLRNALLEFRQQEENHIMENIIYNELIVRGYSVDVGVVEYRHKDDAGRDVRTQLEIDFIAKLGNNQIYVQFALNVSTYEKRIQETASLNRVADSFKKIVVVKDSIIPWIDENGIHYVGIREFLSGNYPDMMNV